MTTVVVTGANAGIGFASAREFVRRGCRVVLVCRDEQRGVDAAEALGGDTELVVGDLATLSGTRTAAAGIAEHCPRIDVLVHNAGIWPVRRELTEDGFERSFAVNHVAPFLLSHLLEPLLGKGSRVVQVSAGLYVKGRVDPARTPAGTDFHRIRSYCDTKLANLLMLPLFATRWQDAGVVVNAVHPGVIRTGLGDSNGPLGLLVGLVKRGWADPADGAAPVVRLALDEPASTTGRYFDVDRDAPLEPVATHRDLARRLWELTAARTGVA
jgi:NAD(P)-dependent dehydrogenase (short-subunit alcohol dehydrogenase family)